MGDLEEARNVSYVKKVSPLPFDPFEEQTFYKCRSCAHVTSTNFILSAIRI
jgi:hypothetical protein